MRRVLLSVFGVLLLVALATYIAGEVIEVVRVRTHDAGGQTFESKVWVADVDGTPWVRVARSGRAWGERLRADPHVELVRGGVTTPRAAVIDYSQQARVDAAFREKYGVVDWWYGAIVRKDPIPVRLDPVP
jgi:hypothetical protein